MKEPRSIYIIRNEQAIAIPFEKGFAFIYDFHLIQLQPFLTHLPFGAIYSAKLTAKHSNAK